MADNRPGPYQVQAAIQAVHTDVATADATEWGQVLALYDQLWVFTPTDVVALNRAVAVAEVRGPAVALDLVDELDRGDWHRWHVVRAELLARLGRDEAGAAMGRAIELADNDAERRFLVRRRTTLAVQD